ncbi:uncharacterized protein PADG_05056 [Paracoccidioides brasiliensis Pb18]|uniref:Uncharacterized protein n=1 Tax=Paracoccidioides brasiliensis (strain Pb18) TaxID=502780 RepID=C1GBQ5_PARBD|nr:uncharacterized protein PADG_05056 [Paracoccidioides brasiliensis Pb18]EEH48977.2 hypothetical protein PADG_05056 [Paracoccidioides brasiliensis Pb18]
MSNPGVSQVPTPILFRPRMLLFRDIMGLVSSRYSGHPRLYEARSASCPFGPKPLKHGEIETTHLHPAAEELAQQRTAHGNDHIAFTEMKSCNKLDPTASLLNDATMGPKNTPYMVGLECIAVSGAIDAELRAKDEEHLLQRGYKLSRLVLNAIARIAIQKRILTAFDGLRVEGSGPPGVGGLGIVNDICEH